MRSYEKYRAVSEVVAAVLLSLVAASLGLLIVYYAISVSNLIVASATRATCKFTIVTVLINKTGIDVYSIAPVLYNYGEIPCTISQIVVIQNAHVLNVTDVNFKLMPNDVVVSPSLKVSGRGIVKVRVISQDGVVQEMTVTLG